jgi:mannitol-1-phosphate/altronate dehydrogenase
MKVVPSPRTDAESRKILPLRESTLPLLDGRLEVPRYDRRALRPAVVHISVGSFHRAHQALYFDDLAQRGISADWGLTGVGMHRPRMREALTPQDGLYTVVSRGGRGAQARVVGAIVSYLFAPEEREAVLATLASPATRLVTLTITRAGYDPVDPGADSAPQLLIEALERRRRAGVPPFTVLSCDNLAENGPIARAALLERAERRDAGLAAWIDAEGAFPSSMVDRITPRTTPAERERIAREFGVADRWPVVTEPFRQWVVEDSFSAGRPPLGEVGARFVADVRPYSLLKTRLLNGGHCALGHLGMLAGHRRSDEAAADPVFRGMLVGLMDEVAPLLPDLPGVDLDDYRRTLIERIANPELGDSLERLCRSSSTKVPEHLIPSLAAARAAGLPHRVLTTVVAGWLRYLRGRDDRGTALTLDDPSAAELRSRPAGDGGGLLADRRFFGDLAGDPSFAAEIAAATAEFDRLGTRGAIRAALGEVGVEADRPEVTA